MFRERIACAVRAKRLHLAIDKSAVHLFDEETGMRL